MHIIMQYIIHIIIMQYYLQYCTQIQFPTVSDITHIYFLDVDKMHVPRENLLPAIPFTIVWNRPFYHLNEWL